MKEWINMMWQKKLELLSSKKFWIATMIAVLAVLRLEPITVNGVMVIAQIWLGSIWSVSLLHTSMERVAGRRFK